jgi:hypothetical protein
MISNIQDRSEPSMTSLVGGIADDLQTLLKQQLQLTRHEIEEEVRKSKEAVALLAVGIATLFLGAIVLCLGLSHLLHWATSPPATDLARFPLWACHGVVGVALVVIGGLVAWVGRGKFQSIHPLDNPATEALKENVEWASNPK